MFNPNCIKTLRTMSASSQRSTQNKLLMEEIDSAIQDLREWKKNENLELKKQLMENQQTQKIIYKSGYEIDEEEEDTRQEELLQQQTDLNNKLQKIRQEYMKEYLKIPKYMASEQKTQEVTQKLQESSQRLENLENYPINQLNLNKMDDDILLKLTQWKAQLAELDQVSEEKESIQQDQQSDQSGQVTANMKQKIQQELDQFQKFEQTISKEQQEKQEFNQHIQQELNDLDKDFDEIDSLLNQCGIK
ncbi:unnamed protein product [Paramecium pentaurelia]|uniref:Uncharacterized protein n=1 Tax=Paramecium pentaurelia TaxID=43138 RepID=A0A8S1UK89_9CILI|nr:unnamed protein product [Paramecium pentaurelia]